MPGTNEEYIRFATDPDLSADFGGGRTWADGSRITADEAQQIRDLWIYHRELQDRKARKRNSCRAQGKAVQLLHRHLSPEQADRLRRKGEFYATLKSGNTYRIDARRGRTEEVTRHGKRWFVKRRFCLHEQSLLRLHMPPADLALTHLLWLLADEQEFLKMANATDARDMFWNGDWMRQLRASRIARQAANPEGEES